MEQNPFITVNWRQHDAKLHLGTVYKRVDPFVQFEVMSDIASKAVKELAKARERLHPGSAARRQLHENARRSHWAEELTGSSIRKAEALRNGHLALELADGRVVVIAAGTSIDAYEFDSLEELRANVLPDDKRFMAQPSARERTLALAAKL